MPSGKATGPAAESRQGMVSQGRVDGRSRGVDGGSFAAASLVEDPVQGTVTDLAGAPVPRARVTLFRRTREWPRDDRQRLHSAVWTGVDGQYMFGITRTRPHLELEVAAAGFATQNLLLSSNVERSEIRMRRGFRVVGCVLDAEDAPCVDCDVFLEARSGSRMRARRTKTDAKGRFEFAGVPAESLRLVARNPDYQPAVLPRITGGEHHFHTLEFLDQSGLRVSGTVVNDSNRRLAGGRVRIYPNTPNGLLSVPYGATTNAEGRFQLSGLAPGAYRMEVCHDEYSSVQRLLSIKRSSVMGLLMELPHRAKFEGRITGIQGSERTSLRVISHFGETATQELDADGSFSFPGIGFSLGLATLELKEGPWCFKATRSRWHSVHLRDEDKQHRFAAMSSSVLAGTVLDDRGNPVSGVRVAVPLKRYGSLGLLGSRRQVLTVTDGEGRYRIRGMSPGEVGVWLLGRGFADQQLAVKVESAVRGASADQPSTAKVYRPAAIEGRVTRGGQPVWGALVMVNRGIYGTRKTRTNKDGSYFLGGLPPGEHALRVRFGVLPIEHLPRPVEVKPGQVVRGVDCDLPSRRIKGRLVDLTETPMPNLLVETPSGVAVATDEDGEFELDIQRAKVWLNVRLREGEPVIQRFPVAVRAREVDVVVRIAPRARLRAKMICLPSDESARGVVVRLEPPPQPAGQRQQSEEFAKKYLPNALQGAWSTLDKNFSRWNRYERKVVERWLDLEDGVIDMSNLPNREVLLTIRAKGYLPYVAVVKLSNSSLKDLGVVKLRRGSRVYGVVVDHVGKPLEGARVVVGRESELANRAAKTAYVTDARGRFMARGISLANRRLYVAADGYATRAYDLKLPRDSLRRRGSPVRIQMQTGATIEVQVENKWGLPLGYMMVRLHRAGELIANGRTDEQGRVAFTHLAKDDYRISVQGRPRSQIGLSVVSTGGNKSYRRRIVLKD